jgi:DNA polymerase-1
LLVAGPEGEAMIARHRETVPFLNEFVTQVRQVAANRGFIRTLEHRHVRFPLVQGQRWYLNKAINKLIQGSAADQTKKAMVMAHEAGKEIRVQVHDELGFSVADRRDAKECVEIMQDAAPLTIPVRCDAEIGPSWGHAEKVKWT